MMKMKSLTTRGAQTGHTLDNLLIATKKFPPQAPCRPFLFSNFPRPQGTSQPKNENQKT